MSPRISIVIPVYNRENYISDCLQSVFDQTFYDWDIWVVDDGSTDRTLEVVHSFDCGKLHLMEVEHGGQARARNKAIAQIESEFVAFLDSDDLWLPKKLEKQLLLFEERTEIGLICSDNYRFDSNGSHKLTTFQFKPPCRGNVFKELCLGPNFIVTSTVITRRECFDKVGMFDPLLITSEDYHMWLRIAAQYEIDYLSDVLVGYRFHDDQSIKEDPTSNDFRDAKSLISVEELYPELTGSFTRKLHKKIAEKAYVAGRNMMVNHEWKKAYEAFNLSLKNSWNWRACLCLLWVFLRMIDR